MTAESRSKKMQINCCGVLLLIILFLAACQKSIVHEEKPPEKIKVVTKTVTHISENAVISVSGILVADKTVPLSFLVPGKVDQVYFDEGDHVKKGQILAKVEIDDYRSNLEIAEAQVFEAQDAYDRTLPLYGDGATAENVFIKFKAHLAQAKAARDIARKKVKDTKLRSPIPGIVGAKNVELGQTISTGLPVFTIVKTDRIFARVSVPESEIGKVALGQKALVAIHALDERDAATRACLRRADFDRVQVDARSNTIIAADDGRDVRAMPGRPRCVRGVDRIGVGKKRTERPFLAYEVVAVYDPGGREQTVCRRVPRIAEIITPGCLVRGRRAVATEARMRIVDAAVEDRNADAAAVGSSGLNEPGADVRHGLGEIHLVIPNARDSRDVSVLRKGV